MERGETIEIIMLLIVLGLSISHKFKHQRLFDLPKTKMETHVISITIMLPVWEEG